MKLRNRSFDWMAVALNIRPNPQKFIKIVSFADFELVGPNNM